MPHNLDELLIRSTFVSTDHALDRLEPLVWRRIDKLRGERLASQLRLGAVTMALVTGLTVGGVGAVAAPRPAGEMAIFSVDAGLSPLVRLETGR